MVPAALVDSLAETLVEVRKAVEKAVVIAVVAVIVAGVFFHSCTPFSTRSAFLGGGSWTRLLLTKILLGINIEHEPLSGLERVVRNGSNTIPVPDSL